MEINLGTIVEIITIITFAAGVTKLLIVQPLQIAIDTLEKAVGRIESMLSKLEEEQSGIDRRLVVVEESTKSAHKRIDTIEDKR